MAKRHVYPFGLVGNCSFISYINEDSNVVWQCWPHFDSSFIFGALLSEKDGGEFSIKPECEFETHQYYRPNTNVLVTEFTTQDGSYRVVDFAPRFELFERFHKPHMLFRKIEKISGSPKVKVTCRPMGDYGKVVGEQHLGSNHIYYTGLDEKVRLTTNISKVHIVNEESFLLTEDKYLVLSWGSPLEAPLERTFEDFLERTSHYWQKWIERSAIPPVYQEEVIRSALLLKLHQFEDTGAIIASGTTSLPEHPGAGRNWDYRFCWVRDSYFTLSALNSLGHFAEAEKYSHYLQNIVQGEEENYQPVYDIDGSKELIETILDLEGYQGNGPVRIGNEAYKQVQYDVYGQVLLSIMPLFTDLRLGASKARPTKDLINKILDNIEKVMDLPDSGIWEYRNKFQKHAESYLFHWAGAMAVKKIALSCEDKELGKRAEKIEKIAKQNIEACYDEKVKAYGMSQENKKLNASEFLLVTMNYLEHSSERAQSHIKALEDELSVDGGLIYRYRDIDDFGETHSTFLICGFWYAEALACIGRVEDAMKVFDNLLSTANHLGILSEDVDPTDKSQWGNFAQTYSHVGLINAAFRISSMLNRPIFF
jgi:GH15 family glucan-1,4-alpha-glucosidase